MVEWSHKGTWSNLRRQRPWAGARSSPMGSLISQARCNPLSWSTKPPSTADSSAQAQFYLLYRLFAQLRPSRSIGPGSGSAAAACHRPSPWTCQSRRRIGYWGWSDWFQPHLLREQSDGGLVRDHWRFYIASQGWVENTTAEFMPSLAGSMPPSLRGSRRSSHRHRPIFALYERSSPVRSWASSTNTESLSCQSEKLVYLPEANFDGFWQPFWMLILDTPPVLSCCNASSREIAVHQL